MSQAVAEPVRRDATHIHGPYTEKEGFVGDAKVEDGLCCSDHEMVEFRILRGETRAKIKIITLDFRRVYFAFLEHLLRKAPSGKVLERKRPKNAG